MNHNDMLTWFLKHYQKTPAQIVSLMGAHTLGRVNESGLNRPWDEGNEDGLGRKYFFNLMDKDQRWINVRNPENGEWHWIANNVLDSTKTGFALACDMTQAKNITQNAIDLPNGQAGRTWSKLKWTREGWKAMVKRYVTLKTDWSKTFPRHIFHVLGAGYFRKLYIPK
jgi:hypothetical protein